MFRNKASFLPPLKLTKRDLQLEDMEQLGVHFVHGTNSSALEGLVKFRALLSAEDIDCTPWFHRADGPKSGERGNTFNNLYRNQPISQGVSLHYTRNYHECLNHYAKLGLLGEDNYEVLIGLDSFVPLRAKFTSHPVSIGGISIMRICAIYVPAQYVSDVREMFQTIPSLVTKVRSFR
ncbi:hypothetical protein [Vibrio barjaei]|uniref:hypothetical protein n=1 Tax=Vibrio barjaei TaxID=1676683 RepID=UPI0007BB7808|nr:hypothetical protein [Vibrio barjaei]OIN25501.1 hypothetical protein AWH66_2016910 [Vibrio barjaei]